jgi:hypothetical protein
MFSKQTLLSDALPMSVWQRLRGLQLGGGRDLAQEADALPSQPLNDEMPISDWQQRREQQVQRNADWNRDPVDGPSQDDLVRRVTDRPGRMVQLAAQSKASSFTPRSERQWEVEAAQAANPDRRERPSSGNLVEQWAASEVGRGGYNMFTDNAPDARGRINDRLVPDLKGRIAFKCNKFVFDALTAAGVAPGRMAGGRIPLAGDWGNPASTIDGFARIDGPPMPGDVVSDGHHVGIYAPLSNGQPGTISAVPPLAAGTGILGGVVHNDWGFRPGQKPPTVWRPLKQ